MIDVRQEKPLHVIHDGMPHDILESALRAAPDNTQNGVEFELRIL